ncbi:tailspike [Salmonella phage vB_SenS_SP8]|nr:tailspike [Salmonella phage vB_SenS_SP8]
MSSGCGEVMSLNDLQIAKKHQIFEAEVITGKQGGVAGGADIDYATNPVTGQTQKTLPAVLRGAGFSPASFNFTTGGTLGVNDADKAVLWSKEDGGDGNYYAWRGSLPKVIPAASTPLATGGISDSAWDAFGDITFRAEADKKFKYSVKLSDFTTLQQLADAAVDSVLIDRD